VAGAVVVLTTVVVFVFGQTRFLRGIALREIEG
jgi:hypothetical protein